MSRSQRCRGRRIAGLALVLALVTPTVTACSPGAVDDVLRGIGIIAKRTDPGPIIDGAGVVKDFCETDVDCPFEN